MVMKSLDFVGNERVINQLGCLIDTERFPHALVIEGEKGLGKLTLARLLAAALVCRADDKPCMQCAQCRKATQGIHPDIFEHCAQGGSNSFHVNVVRGIIKDVYIKPNEADHKVYVLGNADCMNISSQNALLKVLEEPPEYAVFILTVKSKGALLETVLSRCVTVGLEGVSSDLGASYISSHFDGISLADARSALDTFGGNIGKAINSFDSNRENEITSVCCDICKSLVEDNEFSLLCACSAFQKDREAIVFACEYLKNIFRDALLFGNGVDLLSGQGESARLLKSKLTKQKLVDLMDVCDKLKNMAIMNSNNSLLITKMCYSLRQAVGR